MLTSLNISYCTGLVELPASMGNLSQLRELALCSNRTLRRLPDETSRLTALTALTIEWCGALDTQPITSLTSLRRLDLPQGLMPVSVAPLSNLVELCIRGNDPAVLAADLTCLAMLTRLITNGAVHGNVPALSALQRLRHAKFWIPDQAAATRVSRMLDGAESITSLDLVVSYDGAPLPPALATLHNLRDLEIDCHFDTLEWPASMTCLS
jgi:hypothetical protein